LSRHFERRHAERNYTFEISYPIPIFTTLEE